jgi:hypothetical protein
MTRPRRHTLVLIAFLVFGGSGAACAADDEQNAKRFIIKENKWTKELSPPGDLFPRYIADQRRPTFALSVVGLDESDIEGASDQRLMLRVGGRYGLFHTYPQQHPGRGIQIDGELGILWQVDTDAGLDVIGWDGIVGLYVAWAPNDRWVFRVGSVHDSSHIGDEFIEKTGRTRLDYSRQEALVSAAWSFADKAGWVYGEAAYAYDYNDQAGMKPGRLQWGAQYQGRGRYWNGRLAWYGAGDFSSWEEDDWKVTTSLQGGLVYPIPKLGRAYRAGLEYVDGRTFMGEFFTSRERYVGIGLWFDL